jgi:cyclomaltodextrinase / maltogenic alpha-amylase / neopullulanase
MDTMIFSQLGEAKQGGVGSISLVHASARIPLAPAPQESVRLELRLSPGADFDRAWVYYTTDGSLPAGENGQPVRGAAIPMHIADTEGNLPAKTGDRLFRAVLPGQAEGTILRYFLAAVSNSLGEVSADGGTYYACHFSCRRPPAWSRAAVIYHVFVDRFAPPPGKSLDSRGNLNRVLGGTLSGLTAQLDYLAGMGFNTLYLSPVFPSPSYHGYDATDYFDIEPRLGNRADFRRLVDEAHARHMRILLDFVPNHCSDRHPFFQSAIQDPRSPYRSWFTFNKYPSDYRNFFGVRSMPCFDLRVAQARKHILDAALYWLDFGVDGYRIDYAIGPTPDFWADLRQLVHKTHPDCWLIGEVMDSVNAQLSFHGLLDGCLDFHLLEALRNTFAAAKLKATGLAAFLACEQVLLPQDFSRPCFLDNHDMDRFLWAAAGDKRRLKLAALCQFTLPGAPMVYYGTEVGLSQRRSIHQPGTRFGILEEARLPMLLQEDEQDGDLREYYRALVHFRISNPALADGSWELLHTGEAVIAYTCTGPSGKMAVVLNVVDRPQTILLAGKWQSILFHSIPGACLEPACDVAGLALPPLSGVVLA